MVSRLAIFAASLAAALSLAAGLALAGFGPHAAPVDAGVAQPGATVQPPAEPSVQVDTVYVAPPVKPVDVTVSKVATVPAIGEAENEGPGDD